MTAAGAKGRVAFLAHLDTIREMMAAGNPVRTVYQHHVELVPISYSQFCRHVMRYIPAPPRRRKKTAGSLPAAPGAVRPAPAPHAKPRKPFHHDPTRRDELI